MGRLVQVRKVHLESAGMARARELRRLRSSASVFLAPGIWPISNSRPRAWAQEATFSRKKLSGKAVVKSLLMEA